MKNHLPTAILCLWLTVPIALHAQNPELCEFTYGTYAEAAPLPYTIAAAVSGEIDGKIYLTCGFERRGEEWFYRTQLQVYDPLTDTWDTAGSPVPFYRSMHVGSNSVLDGKLYVVGGSEWIDTGDDWDFVPYARVDAYDPGTNSWEVRANLPLPLGTYGICSLDGKLYVSGGMSTGYTNISGFYVYDPQTDQWTALAEMPVPRSAHASVSLGGKIYVIGGVIELSEVSTTSCEVYDPAMDQWSAISPLPQPCSMGAACLVDEEIYYFGGKSSIGGITNKEIFKYNPAKDSWIQIDHMPGENYDMNVVPVGRTIYIIGGRVGNGVYYPEVHKYQLSDVQLDAMIPDDTVKVGEAIEVDLSEYFSHLDGGEITYSACLDDRITGDLEITIEGNMLSMTGLEAGNGEVTVLAESGNDQMGDVFKVRVLSATWVDRNCDNPNSLHVYPNPTREMTTLTYSIQSPGTVRLEVYDMLGKRVAIPVNKYRLPGDYEIQLATSGFEPGIYFCELVTSNSRTTVKIMVE